MASQLNLLTAARSGRRPILPALRHRDLRSYLGFQIVSLIGTGMQTTAQAWLIYRLTKSTWYLGLHGFIAQISTCAVASVGGLVADRVNRRQILICTQVTAMLLAVLLTMITLANTVHVWPIILISGVLGIVNGFDFPARQAFVNDLVDKSTIVNGMAINSAAFSLARILGPALGGIAIARVGESGCFSFNAASYVPLIIWLTTLGHKYGTTMLPDKPAGHSLLAGLTFVVNAVSLRWLLITVAAVSFSSSVATTLMPLFADGILHREAQGFGMLMASGGIGAIVGTVMLSFNRDTERLRLHVPLYGAGAGAVLVLFALSRSFIASMCFVFILGFAMMFQIASVNTLVQVWSPEQLRGRAVAVYLMLYMSMAPIGALIAGAGAKRIGMVWTVGVGGSGLLLLAVIAMFRITRADGRLMEWGEQ